MLHIVPYIALLNTSGWKTLSSISVKMFTFILKSELVGLLNVPWFSCYPVSKQF